MRTIQVGVMHVGCSGPTPACCPPDALSQPKIEGQYMMVRQAQEDPPDRNMLASPNTPRRQVGICAWPK